MHELAKHLERAVRHLVVFQGGMGAKADRAVRAQLEATPPNEERLLLARGGYISEGFDDARLDTLFLALLAGRLERDACIAPTSRRCIGATHTRWIPGNWSTNQTAESSAARFSGLWLRGEDLNLRPSVYDAKIGPFRLT